MTATAFVIMFRNAGAQSTIRMDPVIAEPDRASVRKAKELPDIYDLLESIDRRLQKLEKDKA